MTAAEETRREDSHESLSSLVEELSGIFSSSPQAAAAAEDAFSNSSADINTPLQNTTPVRGGEDRQEEDDEPIDVETQRSRMTVTKMAEAVKAEEEAQRSCSTSSPPMTSKEEEEGRGVTRIENEEGAPIALIATSDDGALAPPLPLPMMTTTTTDEDATISTPMPPLSSSSYYGAVVAAAPCIAMDDDCDCEEKNDEPMFEQDEEENVIRNAVAPPAPASTLTPPQTSPSPWWGSSAPQIVLQHHSALVAPSSYLFVWLLCLSSCPVPSGNAPFDCDLDCRWNATKLIQGRTATETTASSSSAPERAASSSSLQLELKRPRLERAAPLVRVEGNERDEEAQDGGEEEKARRSASDLPYGDADAEAEAEANLGDASNEKEDRSDIVELLPPLLPPLPPPSAALSTLSSKPVPMEAMETTVTSPPLPRFPSNAAWLDGDNDRRCPLHQNATAMATAPRRDENKERAAKTGPRKGRRQVPSLASQIEAQIDGEGVIAVSANGTAFLTTRQPSSPTTTIGDGGSNQKRLPSYYSYYAPPPSWKLTMEGEEHEEASIVAPPPTKPLPSSSSSSSFLHAEEDKSNSSSFYYDSGSSSSSALPFLTDDFSNKSLLRSMKDEENESSKLPRLSSRPDEDDRCTDDAALVFFGNESVVKDEVMTRPRPHQPLPGVQASIPAEGAGVVVDLKLPPPVAGDSLLEGRSLAIATTAALTFAVAACCFVLVAVSIRKRRRRDSRDSTAFLFAPDRTSSPPPPLVPASSSGSSLSADDLTPKKNKSSVVRRLFFNDDRRESSHAKEDDDSSTSWTTATITTVTERSDYQQPVAPAVPKMIRTASSSVLRIDEDRPLAMIDDPDADAVSTTPTQEVDSSCAVVETDRQHAAAMAVPMSAESIRMRCTVLFGASIANSACASARVLACASLMVDRMMLHEESPAMLDRMSDTVLEWIEPLLPLMNAIVNAEFVEIGNRRCSAEQQESSNDGGRVKRVSFCAYDFSSVNTPVDMQQGSHIHLEKSIDALQNVVEEIDLLSSIDEQALIGCESTEVFASVALALKEIASPEGGAAYRKACAEAMPGENQDVWPASRFAHTSELYRVEFEGIIATLEARQSGSSSDASFKSPLRAKLSTLVGSAIRFHLRRLFDLLPVEFSVPSDQRSLQESSSPVRALSILAAGIKSPDGAFRNSGNPDFNICDASVSYVLSRALRRINVFLCHLDDIREALGSVGDNNNSQDTPVALSLTKASTRCLRSKSKELDITDGDKEDILKDVHFAQMCLAAARASEFVVSLFAPDIRDAVDDAGGLDRVESLARILFKFDLDVHYPEESHFALLRDTDDLLKLLELHRSEMATAAQESQSFLKGIWTQFKRGGRKKKHNAHEGVIRQALLDSSKAAIFPSVSTL